VTEAVEAFRAKLPPEVRSAIDRLRAIAVAAHPGLSEGIKWNAPSFALGGEDRITLGISPKGRVRVVLHRGAKTRKVEDLRFADPEGLAAWPAADRAVLTFDDEAEIIAKGPALHALFAAWLAATS